MPVQKTVVELVGDLFLVKVQVGELWGGQWRRDPLEGITTEQSRGCGELPALRLLLQHLF